MPSAAVAARAPAAAPLRRTTAAPLSPDRIPLSIRSPVLAHPEEEAMENPENPARPASAERVWRWPREPDVVPSAPDRAAARARTAMRWPEGVRDHPDLRRMVIDLPDDDAPRQAYAAWLVAQAHPFARTLGAFVTAQLHVAEAFRLDPRADVDGLRSWRGDRAFVSTAEFRAGDALRPWFVDELASLIAPGLVGWPQIYRGFVERVAMRAGRFLELADELFRLAPIRHLVLICVPEVVDHLAASPHLARIRSLSLPRHSGADELSDAVLARLLASPHLGQLAHLRLVHQHALTARAYEQIATAKTLPELSHVEIYAPLRRGAPEPAIDDPLGRAERMIAYDTPIRAILPKAWIGELERAVGYVPCVHGREHYGRDFIDIEAVVAHPIARDTRVRARRGQVVGWRPGQADRP
jgi:hypothetical protein